jgi:hypothetical protein
MAGNPARDLPIVRCGLARLDRHRRAGIDPFLAASVVQLDRGGVHEANLADGLGEVGHRGARSAAEEDVGKRSLRFSRSALVDQQCDLPRRPLVAVCV